MIRDRKGNEIMIGQEIRRYSPNGIVPTNYEVVFVWPDKVTVKQTTEGNGEGNVLGITKEACGDLLEIVNDIPIPVMPDNSLCATCENYCHRTHIDSPVVETCLVFGDRPLSAVKECNRYLKKKS